jgi:hypothetical protein
MAATNVWLRDNDKAGTCQIGFDSTTDTRKRRSPERDHTRDLLHQHLVESAALLRRPATNGTVTKKTPRQSRVRFDRTVMLARKRSIFDWLFITTLSVSEAILQPMNVIAETDVVRLQQYTSRIIYHSRERVCVRSHSVCVIVVEQRLVIFAC